MTRNLPEPKPDAPRPPGQQAYAALEELLRRAGLHKATGAGYVRVDFVQGGIANVKAELNEVIKPNHP